MDRAAYRAGIHGAAASQTLEIECIQCTQVRYHLYAPTSGTDPEQIQAHGIWLDGHPPTVCPTHLDWFLTPDRPDSRDSTK